MARPILMGLLHAITHRLREIRERFGTMLGQHAMHRFVTHDLRQVVDAPLTTQIPKSHFADVERTGLPVLAILKVSSVVLPMRYNDRPNSSSINGIAEQVGQVR